MALDLGGLWDRRGAMRLDLLWPQDDARGGPAPRPPTGSTRSRVGSTLTADGVKQTAATPTGQCWCWCGGGEPTGNFFSPGHDATASRYLIALYESEPGARDGLANLLPSLGFDATIEGSIQQGYHTAEVMRNLDRRVSAPRKKCS